jgi:nucleotide-binding universal stress UspA family protein
VASDIEVSARLLCGTAVPALLHEADRARLLVLGSRGLRGLHALLARSVSIRVAAHARCPVIVVQPSSEAAGSRGSPPRVVVGVDGDTSCSPAVGFAFHAARQRGVSLVALHAWVPDAPADLEAVHGPSTMAEALGRRALERALHRWHPRFPDVPVTTKLVQDEPTRALIAESRGAAMVVIGSRGRGCVRATLLGSVSQSVLQGSHSPLAVIRSLTPGHDTRGTDPTRHESDTPA